MERIQEVKGRKQMMRGGEYERKVIRIYRRGKYRVVSHLRWKQGSEEMLR